MTRPTPDPLARCGFSTRQMKELEKEMKELEEQKSLAWEEVEDRRI